MKIEFKELQEAVAEFNTPYPLHIYGEGEQLLITRMEAEEATPFEFCNYIYRHWGPDKLIRNIMITDKAWQEFLRFRNIRKNENCIKTELEKHRMKYLLERGCTVKEILTSELETFLVLFKYVTAKAADMDDLVELYKEGARYELRTMPELKRCLFEFREEYFPEL